MAKQYKILFTFLIINCAVLIGQTNLVPNPSFEIHDTCPTTADQMSRAMYWSSYCESPDYFNSCAPVGGMSVPYNPVGYQKAVYGNAYAGFVTWQTKQAAPNYREIIGAPLTTTLTIGTKYYFSFFVSNAGTQNYTVGSNNVGVRFSTVSYSKSDTAPVNNIANYHTSIRILSSGR